MDSVFVLEVAVKYEGSDIVGVYSSLEKVEKGKQDYLNEYPGRYLPSNARFVVTSYPVI